MNSVGVEVEESHSEIVEGILTGNHGTVWMVFRLWTGGQQWGIRAIDREMHATGPMHRIFEESRGGEPFLWKWAVAIRLKDGDKSS